MREIMKESLSEEPWLLLLARPARCIKVFSIVLITGLTKLASAVRPLSAHEVHQFALGSERERLHQQGHDLRF